MKKIYFVSLLISGAVNAAGVPFVTPVYQDTQAKGLAVTTTPINVGNKKIAVDNNEIPLNNQAKFPSGAISLHPGDSLANVLSDAAKINNIKLLWRAEPINVNFSAYYTDKNFIVNVNDIFRDMEKSKGMRFEVVFYKNNVLVVSDERI